MSSSLLKIVLALQLLALQVLLWNWNTPFAVVHGFETLPPTALPTVVPDPAKGYAIVNHGSGVFLLTDGAYWSMAVVSSESSSTRYGGNHGGRKTLCVIDQPTGFYSNVSFLAAIREVLSLSGATTVSDLVYSHHHKDHIGNARLLKSVYPRADIHSHVAVQKRLAERGDPDRPVPNCVYASNFTLPKFGLSFYDLGDSHTPGNLAIYHANAKVLMYVDVVFPGWTAFRDLAQAEYTPGFLASQKKLLTFDFELFVGGHLTRLGNRTDVEIQIQYFADIVNNAQTALNTVQIGPIVGQLGTFDPTSRNFLNYWALFELYLSAVNNDCFERTMDAWSGRLGGVDVFTLSHCSKIVESLRID